MSKLYVVKETDSQGNFHCPVCGNLISPDDNSDKNYLIEGTYMVNEELVDIKIHCLKCGADIRLVLKEENKVD